MSEDIIPPLRGVPKKNRGRPVSGKAFFDPATAGEKGKGARKHKLEAPNIGTSPAVQRSIEAFHRTLENLRVRDGRPSHLPPAHPDCPRCAEIARRKNARPSKA